MIDTLFMDILFAGKFGRDPILQEEHRSFETGH
jgi:hypothetical protein